LESHIWESVKKNIKVKNPNNTYLETWFDPIQLIDTEESHKGTVFKLGVPTDFHKNWISNNFLDSICQELSSVIQKPFQIQLVVAPELERPATPNLDPSPMDMSPQVSVEEPENGYSSLGKTSRQVLNVEYTFSTFVVGRNNEFAHAASYNVAKNPGGGYNPLFICGPTGMGKTHLLNAVGNHIQESFPQLKIRYVSTETFLNEFISGIRRNEMHKVRKRYREDCDVLLLDDIQVLGRGESFQEEFFHTMNSFFDRGRQVVVASDRMPRDIAKLEDRIRTRLEWGLIADIQMPDVETRVAILRYKAEKKGLAISDDVINFIARISKRSIRELEGNLNKVKMYTELSSLPINLELTKQILASHSSESQQLTVEDIQKLVSDHFQIKISDLKSSNRSKPIVVARQVCMYLIKTYLEKSLMDIGRAFGGRDHTTVISALKRVEELQEKDSDLHKDIEDLRRKIHNTTGV
jgi:chromosomal replication initiator protein